jgi:hypothetical protein
VCRLLLHSPCFWKHQYTTSSSDHDASDCRDCLQVMQSAFKDHSVWCARAPAGSPATFKAQFQPLGKKLFEFFTKKNQLLLMRLHSTAAAMSLLSARHTACLSSRSLPVRLHNHHHRCLCALRSTSAASEEPDGVVYAPAGQKAEGGLVYFVSTPIGKHGIA